MKTLSKHALLKMKVIRGNHKPVIIRKIEESDYETISFEQRGKYFN